MIIIYPCNYCFLFNNDLSSSFCETPEENGNKLANCPFVDEKKLRKIKAIFTANDHEVEFPEIEICLFHEIELTIIRSKFALFLRLNL